MIDEIQKIVDLIISKPIRSFFILLICFAAYITSAFLPKYLEKKAEQLASKDFVTPTASSPSEADKAISAHNPSTSQAESSPQKFQDESPFDIEHTIGILPPDNKARILFKVFNKTSTDVYIRRIKIRSYLDEWVFKEATLYEPDEAHPLHKGEFIKLLYPSLEGYAESSAKSELIIQTHDGKATRWPAMILPAFIDAINSGAISNIASDRNQ